MKLLNCSRACVLWTAGVGCCGTVIIPSTDGIQSFTFILFLFWPLAFYSKKIVCYRAVEMDVSWLIVRNKETRPKTTKVALDNKIHQLRLEVCCEKGVKQIDEKQPDDSEKQKIKRAEKRD